MRHSREVASVVLAALPCMVIVMGCRQSGGSGSAGGTRGSAADAGASPGVGGGGAVMRPLPPLVESRQVYAQQTDAILTIHLTGDPAAIADVNADVSGAKATVSFTADDYATTTNAELTVHGTTTRFAIQKSFKIKLPKGAPLWRGQRTLVLNKHPYDLTRIRNRLSFEYLETIPNMTSARTQFAHLYVNDADMGLFTQIEYIDDHFLAAHGLDTAGTIYNIQALPFSPIDDQTAADPVALGKLMSNRANPDLPRLRHMLDAVNDPNQDIDAVIARYFDRDNYMTWLAMNVLMGDLDTDSQNFMLYGPSGYEGWYILPWDYDGAWGWPEQPGEPPRPAWRFGLANWWSVILHRRFLQHPKNVIDLTAVIDQLLASTLSDARTTAIAARWHDVVQPFISRPPDLDNLPCDKAGTAGAIPEWETEYARIQSSVSERHAEYVTSLTRPMPVFLYQPILGDPVVLSWQPSLEVLGGPVTYDVLVSRTAEFNPADIVVSRTALSEALLSVVRPPPGQYFWRVIVRDASDPTNHWTMSYQDAQLTIP